VEPLTMPLDEPTSTPLDHKAQQVFGDLVVFKELAQQASFQRLPRYVSEYLLGKYVRPASWREDLHKLQEKLRQLLPEVDQREWWRHRLLTQGELILIDFVEVRVELRAEHRWGHFLCLGEDHVEVPPTLLDQHPGLLLGGMWGTARLRYERGADGQPLLRLVEFIPFQVGLPNLAEYKERRQQFSTDEWLELLLKSCGYAPEAFPQRRTRLLLLARLIPLVENNVNLIELGPRQTGKTFLLRNLSPHVLTLSGGVTSPANLFVNLARQTVGIIGTRKVVVFDEVANTTFREKETTLSILKDYMESGQFSRGTQGYRSDASLVFAGNLEVDKGQPHSAYRHLFEPLPRELIDTAFLDRLHGYLPGWEIPKITPQSQARGVGLVTDYFGEVLVQLRREDLRGALQQLAWRPDMTQRDRVAVERLGSGLMKLLYPHGQAGPAEIEEIAALACELRQRVYNQLCLLAPGEFTPRLIGWSGLTAHQAPDLATSSAASS
jgi:ATP-dependent Lon protease